MKSSCLAKRHYPLTMHMCLRLSDSLPRECPVLCMWICSTQRNTAGVFRAFMISKYDTTQGAHHHKRAQTEPIGPSQLRQEWLTAAVSIWGLSRAILQAVQDLSLPHVAVTDQEKLKQVVIAFHWAALAAHGVSHLRRWVTENFPVDTKDGQTTNPLVCYPSCLLSTSLKSLFCLVNFRPKGANNTVSQ